MIIYLLYSKHFVDIEEDGIIVGEQEVEELLGAYARKEKAEAEKAKHETNQADLIASWEKCAKCPIWDLTKRKYNNLMKKNSKFEYCKDLLPVFYGNSIDCAFSINEFPYKEKEYYITVLEVIE